MTLTELLSRGDGQTGSADSSAIVLDDDLIIGEKVFGVRLSRNAMIGLGIALAVIVVTAAVVFLQQMMEPAREKQEQELRHRYQNREGG